MIGPIPVIEDLQPYVFPNGIAYHYTNERVGELNAKLGDLCAAAWMFRYLNIFDELVADADWNRSQRDCDGVHATGEGYQMIANQNRRLAGLACLVRRVNAEREISGQRKSPLQSAERAFE